MGFINKEPNKQRKFNNNFNIPVYVPDDMEQGVIDEICDVLANTPFNKISVPVYGYNHDIGGQPDDTRCRVIGYVKAYDKDEGKFVVVIFQNQVDNIKAIRDKVVIPQVFTNREGKFTTITRLVISTVPAAHEEAPTSASEETPKAEPQKFEI